MSTSTQSASPADGPAQPRRYRYGDFIREVNVHQQSVSYNYLTPRVLRDAAGREIPYRPAPLRLHALDVARLLGPYTGVRFLAQVRTVIPLALYLAVFQLVILREGVRDSWTIGAGLLAALVGLMLFMEGLKLGLMPLGESIGDNLPRRSPLALVLLVALILGVGVTFAEPAIGALQQAGAIVDVGRAPYLWLMLNHWAGPLVLAVGTGVGLAAVLGTLRFLQGWSLEPYIYLSVVPALALTAYLQADDRLHALVGLAWDCGAVTTGPVTVPLVLALGIGIASAAGKQSSSLQGFGIVTLASLFPVVAVMLLALYVSASVSPEEILALHARGPMDAAALAWWERSPASEILGGVRAIVPLVLFLFAVFTLLLHERLREARIVFLGLGLCLLGMVVFNLGLTYGLALLGQQSGSTIPAAFTRIGGVDGSPLYAPLLGVTIALVFAFVLGLLATLAEPALNALGLTVEDLTSGAFRKSALMWAVSAGVGAGIGVGVVKITFDLPLAALLLPGYGIALVLTRLSSEEFVNIAWDSAGVTTGPVTVPLVLAMGLGFSGAVDAAEGFGILAMASIGPIISVLGTGLYVQYRIRRENERMVKALESARADA